MSETMSRTIQGAERVAMPLGLTLLMVAAFSRVCRYMRWSMLAFGEEGSAPLLDLEPGKMFWGAALALLLLSALRRPNARVFRLDTPLKMLLAFVALAVASLMWSYDFHFALTGVIRLYMPVFIYVLVSSYTRTLRDVRAWTYTFVITGFGAFVFGFYETLFVVGKIGFFLQNAVGGVQYVNEYCQWAVVSFAFGVYFALSPRKPWERAMGIAAMLCSMGTIYITFRRAAPLALGVIMVVYLFTIGMRRRVLWVAPLLAAVALVVVMGANPRYAQRLATIPFVGGQGGIEDFGQREGARVEQFMAGLQTASEHWTHGIGFGATMLYFKKEHGVGMTLPHNIVLYLIGELGIGGFALYMAFLGSGMLRAWRVYRHSMREGDERQACAAVALLASTLGILSYAMFQPLIYDTFFYILTAVSSCMFSAIFSKPQPRENITSPRAV